MMALFVNRLKDMMALICKSAIAHQERTGCCAFEHTGLHVQTTELLCTDII